jgi:hypothetical protein
MATKIVLTPGSQIGGRATLAVETDIIAPYKYVWKKNGVFLGGPDSSNKVYATPILSAADMRASYSCVVYGQDKIEESESLVIDPKMGDPITITHGPAKPAPLVGKAPAPPPPPSPHPAPKVETKAEEKK